jgi:hypothetical protein
MPDEPMLRRIVNQFAGPRTRLLVTGSDRAQRPTVEVAHEALVRTWPRLRGWIDASRDKLRSRAAILQARADWEQNGRRDDMLIPAGLQLERARTLLADPGDITIDDIKAYIAESEAADGKRRAEEVERERQRQAAELEAANAVAAASRRVARHTLAGVPSIGMSIGLGGAWQLHGCASAAISRSVKWKKGRQRAASSIFKRKSP